MSRAHKEGTRSCSCSPCTRLRREEAYRLRKGSGSLTLRAIGKRLGVTTERARQMCVQQEALERRSSA